MKILREEDIATDKEVSEYAEVTPESTADILINLRKALFELAQYNKDDSSIIDTGITNLKKRLEFYNQVIGIRNSAAECVDNLKTDPNKSLVDIKTFLDQLIKFINILYNNKVEGILESDRSKLLSNAQKLKKELNEDAYGQDEKAKVIEILSFIDTIKIGLENTEIFKKLGNTGIKINESEIENLHKALSELYTKIFPAEVEDLSGIYEDIETAYKIAKANDEKKPERNEFQKLSEILNKEISKFLSDVQEVLKQQLTNNDSKEEHISDFAVVDNPKFIPTFTTQINDFLKNVDKITGVVYNTSKADLKSAEVDDIEDVDEVDTSAEIDWKKRFDRAYASGKVSKLDAVWNEYYKTWGDNEKKVRQLADVFRQQVQILGTTRKQNPFIPFLEYVFDKKINISIYSYIKIHNAYVKAQLVDADLSRTAGGTNIISSPRKSGDRIYLGPTNVIFCNDFYNKSTTEQGEYLQLQSKLVTLPSDKLKGAGLKSAYSESMDRFILDTLYAPGNPTSKEGRGKGDANIDGTLNSVQNIILFMDECTNHTEDINIDGKTSMSVDDIKRALANIIDTLKSKQKNKNIAYLALRNALVDGKNNILKKKKGKEMELQLEADKQLDSFEKTVKNENGEEILSKLRSEKKEEIDTTKYAFEEILNDNKNNSDFILNFIGLKNRNIAELILAIYKNYYPHSEKN